jgi:hypothetical protein
VPHAVEDGRIERGSHPWWKVPGGYLVWNSKEESLDAHCTDPRHANNKNPCRTNRKLISKGEKSGPRGRPVGFLLCWLQAQFETQAEHKQSITKKTQTPEHREFYSYQRRLAARKWAEVHIPGVVGLERPCIGDEGSEPTECVWT